MYARENIGLYIINDKNSCELSQWHGGQPYRNRNPIVSEANLSQTIVRTEH